MTPIKPVLLLGNGLRNNPALVKSLCELGVPVLTTWQFIDGVPEDSPVFCGRPGVIGQRAANIIIQKCNWLMVAGARLDMETVGHNLENFAPHAYKTIVDVDYAELEKFKPPPFNEGRCQDIRKLWAGYLMDLADNSYTALLEGTGYSRKHLPFLDGLPDSEWLAHCKALYNKFRYELEGTDGGEFVEPYSFIRELSDVAVEGDVFAPGSSGVQSCAFMQAFKVKAGQRILLCNTIGAMGMEPMAIGAALSSNKRVIVVTGDGGFVQNMGELEVVRRLNLPIHYFIFNNHGYGSISTMQDNRFGGFRVGSTPESGFTLPCLEKIAALYGMPYFEMKTNADLPTIKNIIDSGRATLTSVNSSLGFRYATKVDSSIKDGVFSPDDLADVTPKIEWKKLL